MISLATRRFLKSSIRPSIFNPLIFSSQSKQFTNPKPTLVPSLTPFHIGISNFEFGRSVVRSLTNFDFVSHFSTSSSGWRENAGGNGGSDTGDEFSNLIAEIDRLEKEVKSEKETLGQRTDEFGDMIEEVAGLDLVEREKKIGPMRASLMEFFEKVKAKHERLERLIIRRQDLEVEKLKSHSKALGEAVEQFYSQGRCSNVSNGGGNISWIDKPYVTWLLLWPCMW